MVVARRRVDRPSPSLSKPICLILSAFGNEFSAKMLEPEAEDVRDGGDLLRR